ncbi:MAG: hypothetical protein WDZ40_01040 [Candidatus Spechtbacterales bacterium]
MTCIAAILDKDAIWMGCDSMISSGDRSSMIDSKIIKKGNIIMGFAGGLRDINLLKFGFDAPNQDKKMSDYEYVATVFSSSIRERLKKFGALNVQDREETGNAHILMGYKKRLYQMYFDFGAERIEGVNFYASGSGASLALGSLYSTENSALTPEERIRLALSAAEKFTRSVGGPFIIEQLKFS